MAALAAAITSPPPAWLLQASQNPGVRGCIANEVVPRLWLGRGEFAVAHVARGGNPAGITHVLTVAADTPDVADVFQRGETSAARAVEYLCLDIADFGGDPGLSRKFDEGFAFMDAALAKKDGRLFVHCANGSNRSPTFVLAYLMSRGKCSLKEALQKIQPLKDNMLELLRLERKLTGVAGGDAAAEVELYAQSSLHTPEAFQKMKKKAKAAFSSWLRSAAAGAGAEADGKSVQPGVVPGAALDAAPTDAAPDAAPVVVVDTAEAEGKEWEAHMGEALAESTAAAEAGNHPFGAVLVVDGEVVLRGQNAVVLEHDATRHAELVLVSEASKKLTREELGRSTLVTSTEPCPMCSGAIYWAGIGKVVYGCPAEVLGAISGEELGVPSRTVLSAGILHSVAVVGPVKGEEAAAQHRVFWPEFIARGHSVV